VVAAVDFGPVAAELAADDLNLRVEKPDAGIATSSDGLDKGVTDDVEPAQHGDRIPRDSV
jgi:hypothetical protein